MNLSHLDLHITNWLHNYAISNALNGFVVGVSGGVDSALTSSLCASTGLETHLIELPIHQDKNQSERAISHMKFLKEKYDNVKTQRIDLSDVFDNLSSTLKLEIKGNNTKLSLANTRARLRMTTLYGYAQNHGLLVVGTGNKIEDFGNPRSSSCLTQTLCEKEFPFAKLKESNKIMKNKLSTVNEKIGELQLEIDLDKANIYRLYGFIIVTSFILIYVFMSTISSILGTLISRVFSCFSSCVKIKRKIKRLYLFWMKDKDDDEIMTPKDELV